MQVKKIAEIKLLLRKKLGRNCVEIHYNAKKDRLKIRCPYGFEDRPLKTLEMFLMAFEKAKPNLQGDLNLLLNCEDFPEPMHGRNTVMAYCTDSFACKKDEVITIPDFCFLNWKESGMNDYEQCWNDMVSESKKDPIYDTLFWIGNPKTHPTREELCKLSEKDNRIEAIGMGWDYRNGKAVPNKFISLVDHTQYKYLIDIQGRGYSGRTKMLLFSGRPLFIAERKWKEYWYKDLIPNVHYIPVKEDLSDLVEKLDWAEEHPKEVLEIAHSAQKFALDNLTRESAIDYFSKIIVKCSKITR